MAIKKDIIFVEDTLPVAYECYEPKTSDNSHRKVPKAPVACVARLWSVQAQQLVEFNEEVTVAEGNVEGNVAFYTLPSSMTTEPGDYKLFVTITFDDEQVVTVAKPFKISARQ